MKSRPCDYTDIYPRSRRASPIASAEIYDLSPEEETMFAQALPGRHDGGRWKEEVHSK